MANSSCPVKRILVTGGNKGIGRAICEKLLTDYPDVHILLGSRDVSRGETTISEIKSSISNADGRIDLLPIDVGSDDSVAAAAEKTSGSLYGIVNNAGILGKDYEETLNVNYFGPRRVNDAFSKILQRPGGRIVNVSSATAVVFVSKCGDASFKNKLADPLANIQGGISELDEIAKRYMDDKADHHDEKYGLSKQASKHGLNKQTVKYALSKALLNAYTVLHAHELKTDQIIVNSCTPGHINTDLTKAYGGAPNPPSAGAICPVYLMMSPELEEKPSGRYYGSDKLRSPMDEYRAPGDPEYQGP